MSRKPGEVDWGRLIERLALIGGALLVWYASGGQCVDIGHLLVP